MALAHASPRCGAKRRCDGGECQQPAMNNGRCRFHGGKSTGPQATAGLERARNARLVHGHYTAEAKAERQEARLALRVLRELMRAAG